MSGHNAARTLPPGDRDDVGLPSAPSTGTVAGPGQELQRTIENLIALRATIRRRMQQKQRGRLWPYTGIGKDREALEAATTAQLKAEIAAGEQTAEPHKEAA